MVVLRQQNNEQSQRIQALEQTNANIVPAGADAQVSRTRVQRVDNHVNGTAHAPGPGMPGLTDRIAQFELDALCSRMGMLRTAVEHIGTYINEANTYNFAAVEEMLTALAADVNTTRAELEVSRIPALMDIEVRMLEGRFVDLIALAAWPHRDAFDQQIDQEVKIEESA